MYVPPDNKPKGPPNPAECTPMIRDGAEFLMRSQMLKVVEALNFDHMKTCLTCVTFREFPTQVSPNYTTPPAYCVKWQGQPPARIIAYGCPSYAQTTKSRSDMKSTIGLQLTEFKVVEGVREPKGIYSRGANMELFGTPCQYIGPTPDMLAHFWLGVGRFESLTVEQLEEQGLTLWDFADKRIKK